MKHFITAALLALGLAACATEATVQQAPLDQGIARDFDGDLGAVREAARATLQSDMPVTMQGVREEQGATIFSFEISMSAFTWGEVGRVVVMPVDADTTRVIVRSEKRMQTQIIGEGERRLAERLFTGVQTRLAH